VDKLQQQQQNLKILFSIFNPKAIQSYYYNVAPIQFRRYLVKAKEKLSFALFQNEDHIEFSKVLKTI